MTAIRQETDALLDDMLREHSGAIHRICRARLGNESDAEDAVQEVMLRAWMALPAYDTSRPLRPWLSTIARNVCTDFHRRRSADERRRSYDRDVVDDPGDRVVADERDAVMREALGRLPQRSAKVLYLREVEGWDYDRIAAEVDTKPGAARTAVTRARQQLRSEATAIAVRKDQWPLLGVFGGLVARIRVRAARSFGGRGGATGSVPIGDAGGVAAAGGALAAAAILGVGALVSGMTERSTAPGAPAVIADGDHAPTGDATTQPIRESNRPNAAPEPVGDDAGLGDQAEALPSVPPLIPEAVPDTAPLTEITSKLPGAVVVAPAPETPIEAPDLDVPDPDVVSRDGTLDVVVLPPVP